MKKTKIFKKPKIFFILLLGLITFLWSIRAAKEVSIILVYVGKMDFQNVFENPFHDNYTTSLFKRMYQYNCLL